MTVPNQQTNMIASIVKPGTSDQAGSQSLSSATAPAMMVNSETAAKIGQGLPWGM